MKRRAVIMIRAQPHYRRDAFESGLLKSGFQVLPSIENPQPGDVLLTWNRYGASAFAASVYEKAGAQTLVVENGYFGRDSQGRALYSIHNKMLHGYGSWYVGQEDRFEKFDIKLENWRRGGDHALVFQQRGIGTPPVSSPPEHANVLASKIKTCANITARIRKHPGDNAPPISLESDLSGALFAATHTSSAGLKAMAMGVPVVTTAEKWLGIPAAMDVSKFDDAAWRGIEGKLIRSDSARLDVFKRIAWAQWTVDEISNGIPFRFMCT